MHARGARKAVAMTYTGTRSRRHMVPEGTLSLKMGTGGRAEYIAGEA
jgi:hypothetical protein